MQLTFNDTKELEQTLSRMASAAEALADKDTNKKVADLLYLMAEIRVLAANPRDLEAINRFTQLFTE